MNSRKLKRLFIMVCEANLCCQSNKIVCMGWWELSELLCINEDVVVAGAALNGHQYLADQLQNDGPPSRKKVPLTGRTTPWNTLCVWNLEKLSMTGFSLISDLGKSAGVEECAAIAMLQKLFPKSEARLVKIDGIEWEDKFQDEERQKWHDEKMKSKVERPKNQLEILGLSGSVIHC